MSAPLHVRCPSCVTEYALPESLMGPHGARVSCPACGTRFSVPRLAAATPVAAAAGVPGPARSERPLGVAEACVSALDPERERLLAAAASGRLMAEFGPALLDAFDAYRRAAGAGATRHAFARALRARHGVSLPLAEGEAE